LLMPLSSHVDKWTAAEPELALALRFADAASRPRIAALICLEHEIVHAALHIAERDVALVKLNWWAEELAALAAGAARHPLTQTLGGNADLDAISAGTMG
jgi:phytoene synthase